MRASLADALQRDRDRPVLAGFSGGLDSTVLLHLLAADPGIRAAGLRAIHVHHGLHADADAWAAHCRAACEALAVPLAIAHVQVDRDAGLGLEGAAREARHRAFADALGAGEVLALAHHRDDQAETFLLRALRGSGVDALAAMAVWRRFAPGLLWRPLLDTSREALLAHAVAQGLRWIEDPGNGDHRLDRNFLRHGVLPMLRQRWPHAAAAFARSARLASEASRLLDGEDQAALAGLMDGDGNLQVAALHGLPVERRARALRRWVAAAGLPPLPGGGIDQVERGLLACGRDATACFDWRGARIQRWRGLLHAGRIAAPLPADWSCAWDGRAPLPLPTGDSLALHGVDRFEAPLRAHARQGGERIRLPGRGHTHALKHALQDAGVPPWRRARMPLLSGGGELLAAGDTLLSARLAAWLQANDARLEWKRLA